MPAAVSAPPPRSHSRRRLVLRMLAGLLLLLVIVRLLLPWLLERVVNQRLGRDPAYYGIVGDIDLAVFRGAARFQNLTLRDRGASKQPLISVRTIDFSLAWRELLRGRIVADIELEAPIVFFSPVPKTDTGAPPPAPAPPRPTRDDWRELVRDLFPIEITRLVVTEGSVHYLMPDADPPLTLGLEHLAVRVEGLSNRLPPEGETDPATAIVSAAVQGGGLLLLEARGAPLAEPPRFEGQLELEDVWLPTFTPILRDALGVEISGGLLDVAAEISAAGGRYQGYVKPLIHDAEFTSVIEGPGDAFSSLKAGVLDGITNLLSNDQTENAGTRVPFSGRFDQPDVEAWEAFVSLLRNAFVEALRSGVEDTVAGAEP